MSGLAKGISIGTGGAAPTSPVHRFPHDAMGSIFEILIPGESADYARHAATAAFEELDRLYRELNRFTAASDVSRANTLGAGESVRVGLATFECLAAAAKAWAETGGAFDVTIGRLFALWTPRDGAEPHPSDAALAEARRCTGMGLLELVEEDFSVGVKCDGVQIDLGGIGKGYAVDQMAAVLREWSVATALMHGGHSSVLALGSPPGKPGWAMRLPDPKNEAESLGNVHLQDRALSGSGIRPNYKHIIDPRTGRPAAGTDSTWVLAKSGTVSDALSTAFLVMSPEEVEHYCGQHPDASGILVRPEPGGRKVLRYGKWDT